MSKTDVREDALAAIDLGLGVLRLFSRLQIRFSEVQAMHDRAEDEGEPVSVEDRQALADRARAAIDRL